MKILIQNTFEKFNTAFVLQERLSSGIKIVFSMKLIHSRNNIRCNMVKIYIFAFLRVFCKKL